MKDPRPLSERFDLTYVRHRTWPNNLARWASFALVLAVGGVLAVLALRRDNRIYTAGTLTTAHAMFGDDCRQCHLPDPSRSGYWLPPSDKACLQCHTAAAHPDPHQATLAGELHAVPGQLGKVVMSGNCADCHVEHKGRDHDLNRIDDRFCVQCHGDLKSYWKSHPALRSPDRPALMDDKSIDGERLAARFGVGAAKEAGR